VEVRVSGQGGPSGLAADLQEDVYGPFSGQVMTSVAACCRRALTEGEPRLVEAMYLCAIQTSAEALSGVYAVLYRRRARVLREEMREGSDIFLIHAHLPVEASFGLADELRRKSSGAASASLLLSHWERLAVVIDAGFEENLFISNIKIALGLAAIGFALLAQFGPGKFPSNWWMVAGCVTAYCAVTVILNWFSYKYEGDSYLVTKPSRAGEPGPRLSSRLPKYDDKYTLVISSTLNRKAAGHKEVSLTASVADFFHADGYLSDAAFKPR
ncbi:Tr-type G domain-containing protein, partial [Haematococcus lacustris]